MMKIISFLGLGILMCSTCLGQSAGIKTPGSALFRGDMSGAVDPSTGNFQTKIKLFDIPGPEGSFPVTLEYRAGIGRNQTQGWVDFGWSLMDAGIMRTVSEIPDDYNGGKVTNYRFDYFETSVDVEPREDENFWDFLQQVVTFVQYWDVLVSIVSGEGLIRALAIMEVVSTAEEFSSLSNSSVTWDHNPPSSWDYQISRHGSSLTSTGETRYHYTGRLNSEVDKFGYGLLYQHNMPSTLSTGENPNHFFNPMGIHDYSDDPFPVPIDKSQSLNFFNKVEPTGIANEGKDVLNVFSDIYQHADKDTLWQRMSPVFWATDNYMVVSPFINGKIFPFRFDNPSVAAQVPTNKYYNNTIAIQKLNLVPARSNKPGFGFLGDQSNYYDFHRSAYNGSVTGLNFRSYYFHDEWLDQDVRAPFFLPQNIAIRGQEEDREGFSSGKLVRGTNIEWWSNEEIKNGVAFHKGFMDHQNYNTRSLTGTTSWNKTIHPASGIGGFMITDKSGMTYHFSLPVYVNQNQSTLQSSESYMESVTLRVSYAYEWRLTGITGPDFVDSGTSPGQIDIEDKGFFVKFEYGKISDNKKLVNASKYLPTDEQSTFIHKEVGQIYYLNKISTRTHSALFIKSPVIDAYGNLQSLRLNKAILVKNSDLAAIGGLSYGTSNSYLDNVLMVDDITPVSERVKEITLSAILLERNSSSRLVSLQQLGNQENKSLPAYKFSYFSYEPEEIVYNKGNALDWDAWGMYKYNTEIGPESHRRESKTAASQGSLNYIRDPQGRIIQIHYESDDYSSVMGKSLGSNTSKLGGDIRVSKMESIDPDKGTNLIYNYIYTQNGYPSGRSSGVACNEPPFAHDIKNVADSLFGFISNAVFYSRVEEVIGTEEKILGRQVFKYHVPDESLIESEVIHERERILQPVVVDDEFKGIKYGYRVKQLIYNIQYHDQIIGKLSSVENYDRSGVLLNKTEYHYEPSSLGRITQGLNLYDQSYESYFKGHNSFIFNGDRRIRARFINTILTRVPYRLKKISTHDYNLNQSQEVLYKDFDFYTGQPKTVISTDGHGNQLASVSVPAYSKNEYQSVSGSFQGMEPAGLGGKNLLTPIAESYTYKLADQDYETNPVQYTDLMAGVVQTWDHDGDHWRPKASYQLNKPSLNPDGTVPLLESSEEFPFDLDNPTNEIWEKQGEVSKYNDQGKPIEQIDASGRKSAIRYSADGSQVVAVVSGAGYEEFVFSGAEGGINSSDFEEGIDVNDGQRNSSGHTGSHGLTIPKTSRGFSYTFKPGLENRNKVYRVSVWVSSGVGLIRFRVQHGGSVYSAGFNQLNTAINGWRLFESDIDLSNYSIGENDEITFEVYNSGTSLSGNTYLTVDDFRVAPVSSSVQCFIYNDLGKKEYVLDDDHYYTKYEYDEFGRVKSVYQETNTGIKKLSQYQYNLSTSPY